MNWEEVIKQIKELVEKNEQLVEENKQLKEIQAYIEKTAGKMSLEYREKIHSLELENESLKDDIENLKYELKNKDKKSSTIDNITYSINNNPILNSKILKVNINKERALGEILTVVNIEYRYDQAIYSELKRLALTNEIVNIKINTDNTDIVNNLGYVANIEITEEDNCEYIIKTNIVLAAIYGGDI